MKTFTKWTGPLIGLLGMIFVVQRLADHWAEVGPAIGEAEPTILGYAFLVGLGAIAAFGVVWRSCLATLGHRVDLPEAVYQYFVGQLGKYVPGGVWPVVGRAEMAHRSGATRATSYWATVLAMGLTYLAAIFVSLMVLASQANLGAELPVKPVVALLPVGLVLLHPKVLNACLSALHRLVRKDVDVRVPRWSASIGLLMAYVPVWLGVSASTWLVALAFTGNAPDVLNLVFATTLSWTVGFLIIPVPGGIGVREVAFVAAATSLPSAGMAAAVAVVARFIFITADVVGAGLTTVLSRRNSRPSGTKDEPS